MRIQKPKLEEILGKGRVEKNKDLTPYLTIRTKTKAQYFFIAKTREDLIKSKQASLQLNLPLLILAGGSNLAITRELLTGLIVKNNYIAFKKVKETKDDVLISVSSGYPVNKLVNETVEEGWGGFQYHRGLPGTVGGAIFNNSKWTKPVSSFGDHLLFAYLVDSIGSVKKAERSYFRFAYDYSILHQTKEILLEMVFSLKKEDSAKLEQQAKEAFAYRRQTQPQGAFTSGCFFKNVAGKSAGALIDKAGLKDFRVGNFQVSDKHANFIINRGDGKAEDLKKLINIIKKRVKEKFGVELKEEVIII